MSLEFYTDRLHKARKVHHCDLCNQRINIGEKYHRYSGKYDGEFFDDCYHGHCYNMITEFYKKNNENEYSPDLIEDWLIDVYCYDCEQEETCLISVFRCGKILKDFPVTD